MRFGKVFINLWRGRQSLMLKLFKDHLRRGIKNILVWRLTPTEWELRVSNTRRVSAVVLVRPGGGSIWSIRVHRRLRMQFLRRFIREEILSRAERGFSSHEVTGIRVRILHLIGYKIINARMVMRSVRRAKRGLYTRCVIVNIPRAHGYIRLKKWARRKKRLQRARAKRLVYAT